jgi:hypothetical protein
MEDDQFGNTNKQTNNQTNRNCIKCVKPDEVLLNQMWWSIHMVCTHDNNISLSDLSDDDDDDMRWWRYWWCIYTEMYKGAARDECIYKAWELPNLFQVWVVCSFLALHSRVSNCSNLFFCSSLICLLGKLDWDPDPERLDCSSIAWLLLLLHTDVVTIWRWSWR